MYTHPKKPLYVLKTTFLVLFFTIVSSAFSGVFAQEESADHGATEEGSVNISEVIVEHVLDNHSWHFFEGHYGTWFLPVIVYSPERGLETFSSRNFLGEHHEPVEYNGYSLQGQQILLEGKPVLDLSITKNVMMLFINAALLVIIMLSVSRAYRRNEGKAPRGLQSLIEPIVVFVKEEIVMPNIGPKYERYLPYMLTLFFFILLGNLLGLFPGSANLTGNIAVTMTLAVFTFIITTVSGNKAYWKHILWTPGVPLPLRIIILPVEIISMFTKPFALMIRLFAAITAGHIVLLSLFGLIFIFQSWLVGFGASLFVLVINLIELLVAGIQAYVFTLFSSLYIGMAIEEHAHEEGH